VSSGNGTSLRPSGWQRVLGVLNDRAWHSSHELATTCSVLTHSRIAECRGKGYTIESRRVPGEEGLRAFQYRLTETPGAGEPRDAHELCASDTTSDGSRGVEAAAVSSPAPGAPDTPERPSLEAGGSGAPVHTEQLTIEAVA
jgi:hypothetical protein